MARILVVDDESDFRMMLGKVLAMEGHQVLFAGNGWEALLVLDGDGVDLCIVDLMMPGMDGTTLLKILRDASRHKALPVIVVSGRASELDRVRGFDRGADDYLPKPFSYRELLARIRAVLRRADIRAGRGGDRSGRR